MDVQVKMHLSYKGNVWAYGTVTLNRSIKFPIYLRKYKNQKTGEEDSFLSVPRRKQNQTWSNVIDLDQEVKDIILAAALQEIKEEIQAAVRLSAVEVVSVNAVSTHVPIGLKAYICGVATAKICGVTIHGITIKQGEKGLFINMPQYADDSGYHDIVYGISKDMQERIAEAVITQYQEKFCVPKFGTERKTDE